jgi:hypothetical protein
MTKGEAYKRYYEANKATILARNKEASKEYRAKLKAEAEADPAVKDTLRAKGRDGYRACKSRKHQRDFEVWLTTLPDTKKETYRAMGTAPVYELSAKAFAKLLNGLREEANKVSTS